MEEVTSHCEIRLSRATAAVGRQGASLFAAAPYVSARECARRGWCAAGWPDGLRILGVKCARAGTARSYGATRSQK